MISGTILLGQLVTTAMKVFGKLLVLFAAFLGIWLLNPPSVYATNQPIALGMSADFSGASRSIGIELYKGFVMNLLRFSQESVNLLPTAKSAEIFGDFSMICLARGFLVSLKWLT